MTSSTSPPSETSIPRQESTTDVKSSWIHHGPLANLWRIKSYCRPYRYRFYTLWLLTIVTVILATTLPRLIGFAIDGPIADGDIVGLWKWAAALFAVGLLEAATIWVRRHFQIATSYAVEADMRQGIYEKLQGLHTGFHDRFQSGQLLARATSDLGMIRRFFSGGMTFLIHGIFITLLVFLQLLWIDWRLALLSMTSVVPLYLVGRAFFRDYIPQSRKLQNKLGDIASKAEESAFGIRAVKAMGRGPLMAQRFDGEATTARDIALTKERIASRTWSIFDGIGTGMLGILLVIGILLVTDGQLSVGELTAFMLLQMMLLWPMEALGWVLSHLNEAATASDRIYDILDTPPAITDPVHPVTVTEPRGELSFRGVGFTYGEAEGASKAQEVLTEVNLTLQPGETLALAGKTGSGKSTLAQLPSRLADPTRGQVTLDGVDVRRFSLSRLRSVVTTAFEEPTLFSMSVRENLTLGRPDASQADIEQALRVAQADFVRDLPHGLDTRVGEQGLTLSGGQRQRLALARAVIVRPTVLVLDDPLSALDVHTEELVERALHSVLGSTTALIVVHRPSTVSLADRVALLHDGRITAVGTHSELLRNNSEYADVLSATEEAR
nr:ABC transporter ATP-binding protein [Haloglycomyces albus]